MPNMDKVDVWRFRAESFERSFYSLRTVEWQVHAMYYAGVIAVVSGAWAIPLASCMLVRIAIAGVALVFLFLIFRTAEELQDRVQERMHFARTMQSECERNIHGAVEDSLPLRPDGLSIPVKSRDWARAPLRRLNMITGLTAASSVVLRQWVY